MADLIILPSLTIPDGELRIRAARSSGPGGQHVNRVSTKVELSFDIGSSPSLSEDQRRMLLSILSNRVDSRGILHMTARESRSQWKNRQDVLERFRRLLAGALTPRKKRKKTFVPEASREQRLERKKKRSARKKLRQVRFEE